MISIDIIDSVIQSFYDKAKKDILIGYQFRVIDNFDTHIPKIVSFWQLQLNKEITNRDHLPFNLLKLQAEASRKFGYKPEHVKDITVDVEDISVNKSVTIDDALKEHIKATEGVLDPGLFEVKPLPKPRLEPKIEDSIIAVDVKKITPEKELEIGKPLEFDKTENHSFTEWLKITSFKPINRDKNEAKVDSELESETEIEAENDVSKPETESPLDKKLALIDKFITENPKIKPISDNTPKPKLVNNDNAISDSLMTETLARIYLEQKNYDKAIQSYKILSLKYPEKSSFFAHQIKLVQELKDNNTK